MKLNRPASRKAIPLPIYLFGPAGIGVGGADGVDTKTVDGFSGAVVVS